MIAPNTQIVLNAFDHLGGTVNHKNALIAAISQIQTVSEVMATQLVGVAVADGVLVMNGTGELRKGPAA